MKDKHVTINGQHQAPRQGSQHIREFFGKNIWSVDVLIERMNKTKVSWNGKEIASSIHHKYLF